MHQGSSESSFSSHHQTEAQYNEIYNALYYSQKEQALELIERCEDINFASYESLALMAANTLDLDLVKAVLDKGFDVNARLEGRSTLLDEFADSAESIIYNSTVPVQDDVEAVVELLEKYGAKSGVELDLIENGNGLTTELKSVSVEGASSDVVFNMALQAVLRGDQKLLAECLSQPEFDPNAKAHSHSDSLIEAAVRHGKRAIPVIKQLVEADADIDVVDSHGKTLIERSDSQAVIDFLTELGAKPGKELPLEQQFPDVAQRIREVVKNGTAAALRKVFIDTGIDIDAPINAAGQSALFEAVGVKPKKINLDRVTTLIEDLGANPATADEHGSTALDKAYAGLKRSKDKRSIAVARAIVEVIEKAGGETGRLSAEEVDKIEAVADTWIAGRGNTPAEKELYKQAKKASAGGLSAVADRNEVSFNHRFEFGQTALHLCLHDNADFLDAVVVLLEHHADPNIKDNHGDTFLDTLADRIKYSSLIKGSEELMVKAEEAYEMARSFGGTHSEKWLEKNTKKPPASA